MLERTSFLYRLFVPTSLMSNMSSLVSRLRVLTRLLADAEGVFWGIDGAA